MWKKINIIIYYLCFEGVFFIPRHEFYLFASKMNMYCYYECKHVRYEYTKHYLNLGHNALSLLIYKTKM